MACANCSIDKGDGKPGGCGSGGCASGGCNRLNTYDWLSTKDIEDPGRFQMVEVSFKNGARKDFFYNNEYVNANTGDKVIVETSAGYDLGMVSLSGELVRVQMKKKKVNMDALFTKVIRIANKRDIEKAKEARKMEQATMVRSRVIARTLGLEMKIGDVEYQADKRKATFFYIADGRVDFRELIRHFAKEFRVKIEMRQIGARQESARIGGLGSCGRELCCSTWLTDFKSVSTAAARYQNLAINQAKLSGQCGRLKCCLNYELDSYMDALEAFPRNADSLYVEAGDATLVKSDIFKGLMYYAYIVNGKRGKIYPLTIDRVKEILAANKKGEKPTELMDKQSFYETQGEIEPGFDQDVTGVIDLPPEERKKKKRRRNRNKSKGRDQGKDQNRPRDKDKDKSRKPKPSRKKTNKSVDSIPVDKSRERLAEKTESKPKDKKTKPPKRRPDNRKKQGQGPNNKGPENKAKDGNPDKKKRPNKRRNNRRRPGNKKPGDQPGNNNNKDSKDKS